jgi:hypothetical protein
MGSREKGRETRDRELVSHIRQTDLFDPAQFRDTTVTIIGAGNIGSHTAIAVARMGLSRIAVVDYDTVEPHNLASQAYDLAHIGRKKVDALAEIIQAATGTEIVRYPVAYNAEIPVSDLTIIAVDSLETRRKIAGILAGKHTFIVDGRMGAGQVEIHTGTPETYPATIPGSADPDPCSGRYISYTSYVIAGLIANTIKRQLSKQSVYSGVWVHTDTIEVLKV